MTIDQLTKENIQLKIASLEDKKRLVEAQSVILGMQNNAINMEMEKLRQELAALAPIGAEENAQAT
jgi:hypothetical protein